MKERGTQLVPKLVKPQHPGPPVQTIPGGRKGGCLPAQGGPPSERNMFGRTGSRPEPRPSERPRRTSEGPPRPGEADTGAGRTFARAEGGIPKEPARGISPALEVGGACLAEAPMGTEGTVVTPKFSMPQGGTVFKEKDCCGAPDKGREVREVNVVESALEPEDEGRLYAPVKTVERRAVEG